MELTVELFNKEIEEATKNFEKFVVCIEKIPEHFQESLSSLTAKAITAYENRAPHLRHGIALDKYLTVIISQADGPRPFCGIYFNLSSPYKKAIEKAKPEKSEKPDED
jgi:hypothetical protein